MKDLLLHLMKKQKNNSLKLFFKFNQFKIENISDELAKRGFNLENKVDLVVSNWTLRHLVDPFGTLKQIYGFLTPTGGKFLSNGFLFKFSELNEKLESESSLPPNFIWGIYPFY